MLPDMLGDYGKAKREYLFTGTVMGIDTLPGLPGVRVELDQQVNGARDCYATHAEIREYGR